MEHAYHFMKYLAKKDKAFKGIDLHALRTSQPGSGQIYDYVRKHLGKHDEKPVTTSIMSKAKTSPPKAQVDKIIDEPIKDQDPVKMEAKHIPGHMEERDVPYRKEQPSSEGVEPSKQDKSELDDEVSSISDTSSKVRDQHKEVKRTFRELMDAQAMVEIHEVYFSWKNPGNVTFNMETKK